MDQNNTKSTENFLNRIYNTFFSDNKEKASLEDEIKVNKILDKTNGIFDTMENRIFKFGQGDVNPNIFESAGYYVNENNDKQEKAPDNNTFNTDFLNNIDINRGERPEGSGGRFDQIS